MSISNPLLMQFDKMKKALLFITLLWFSAITVMAQSERQTQETWQQKVEKLRKQLDTAAVENKVEFYTKIYEQFYINQQKDSLENVLMIVEDILNHTNVPKLKYNSNMLLGNHAARCGQNEKALAYYTAALAATKSDNSLKRLMLLPIYKIAAIYEVLGDREKALSYYREGVTLAYATGKDDDLATDMKGKIAYLNVILYNKVDTAIAIYKENIAYYQKINDIEGELIAYHDIGQIFMHKQAYDSAIYYGKKAFRISQTTEHIHTQIALSMLIATSYMQIGKYNLAISYADSALQITNKYNHHFKSGVLSVLGNIYVKMGSFKESIRYFEEVKKIYEEQKNQDGLAATLASLGDNYFLMKEYDTSLAYYLKSAQIYESINILKDKYKSLRFVAEIYYRKGNTEKAIQINTEAYNYFSEIKEQNGQALCLGLFAMIYLDEKDYKKAKEYAQKALEISFQMKQYDFIKNNALLAHRIDSAMGNFEGALANYKIYSAYQDSLLKKDNTSLVYEYQAKYESAKLRAENAEANSKLLAQESEKLQLWFAIIFASLLSVGGFVGYTQQRKRKKIAEQNAEIQAQNAKIQQQLAEESKKLAEESERRLHKEAELSQRNEEFRILAENKNKEAALKDKQRVEILKEVLEYLENEKYKEAQIYIQSNINAASLDTQAELEKILRELDEFSPRFFEVLIEKHPDLLKDVRLQNVCALLAENKTLNEISLMLFDGAIKTAKNNMTKLFKIIGTTGDSEAAVAYLQEIKKMAY
jgi:tetratricopeptide (TPR) repeat protein